MRGIEQRVLRKLQQDFPKDIDLMERGLDSVAKCVQIMINISPMLHKPNVQNNLLNANDEVRSGTVQVICIEHSFTFLKAARLLLLTGYISPSLSCLRTAFESFQNAYICSVRDDQAIRFIKGNEINRKVDVIYPQQLDTNLGRQIKNILAMYGVHPNFNAIEMQALFEGSVFTKENYTTYKFMFIRNVWSYNMMVVLLLDYLLERNQKLIEEVPEAPEIARELVQYIEDSEKQLEKLSNK